VEIATMSAAVFPKTTPGGRIFRPQAARFFAWAWIVFAVANLADIAWRGRDLGSLVAATVMILGCGVAYAAGLRPRIMADETGVHLHNLVRDVRVPWHGVERVDGGEAVCVHSGGQEYRAFVMQSSPRSRARYAARAKREDANLPDAVAEHLKDRTQTDFVVEQLREIAQEHRAGTGPAGATVIWAWPPILAVIVPAAAFIVAVVLAVV
jgi:hypothetical protein